jgi:Ca2+/Na+ antiporter
MEIVGTIIVWCLFGGFSVWILRAVGKERKFWFYLILVALGPLALLALPVIFIIFVVRKIRERRRELASLTPEQRGEREKKLRIRAVAIPVTFAVLTFIVVLILYFSTRRSWSYLLNEFLKLFR